MTCCETRLQGHWQVFQWFVLPPKFFANLAVIFFGFSPVQLVCRISLHRSTDRHACPSACPVQSVCCISLRCFSDRHACPSECPVRSVCRISLHRSSNRHAHPSECLIRLVCRISLCRSSDRHVHPSAYPIRLVCRNPLCCSSDRHARPSACPIRSDCRISLRCSSDWHLRHSRVLTADLRLFSFSQDVDTAFAAALLAPALVITMIQTDTTPMLQRSVAEEYHMPKRFFQWQWWYGVNNFEVQNTDMQVYGLCTSTRQKNSSMLCKQGDNMFISIHQTCQVVVNSMLRQQGDTMLIVYQSCHAIVKQDD
jgi:hypothetical protein